MINGILNIYKEKGYTSHDVVAKLRKILHQKKIGHTGTLDPEAEGILPICLGKGTKVSSLLTDTDKTYEATLTLGISTDTQDHTGAIIEEHKVNVSEDEVNQAVMNFLGSYEQTPPMYSALKINGKKLYELAREGIEIERKTRTVSIYAIEILEMNLPNVKLRVKCSKGTYIRTLCYDIGKQLGCGGHMSSLLRTQVGIFDIEDSLKLQEVEDKVKDNTIDGVLYKIEDLFDVYKSITVKEAYHTQLYNGNKLKSDHLIINKDLMDQQCYRIYDKNKQFIGLFQYNKDEDNIKPVKMFL
jgi:tRNA pseudouridine55 synthase